MIINSFKKDSTVSNMEVEIRFKIEQIQKIFKV